MEFIPNSEESVTGKMDRCISEMYLLTKASVNGEYGDEITQQTLKHHAEDMMLAAQAMLTLLGRTTEQINGVLREGNSE